MKKHFRQKVSGEFKLTGITRKAKWWKSLTPFLLIKILLLTGLLLIPEISAQSIFPNLSGQELLDSLVANYRPAYTLDYTTARDVMFGILDNHDDSVSCVYTGYTVFVPDTSSDPHTVAFNAGLNTEHTWPQSLGATGQAKSDLHHLYPTRIDVNSDRGNLPYAYIPTNQVDRWYRLAQILTTPPIQFVDEYSKADLNVDFEPRLDHKGNAARSIFYFYTMYSAQSVADFFLIQKDILRYWNSLDPPDAAEIQRTELIATYQDGKANPFVLDTTLIGRAYFGVTSIDPGNLQNSVVDNFILVSNYPNPFNNNTVISVDLPRAGQVQTEIFNSIGQLVKKLPGETVNAGNYKIYLNCDSWASGIYLVQIQFEHYQQLHKMVLLR